MKQENKENKYMIIFTIALGSIVAGSVIYQHVNEPQKIIINDLAELESAATNDSFIAESAENENILLEEVPALNKASQSNTELLLADISQGKSFSEAFAAARIQLGPGKYFMWNGMKYSTLFAEEEIIDTSILSEVKTKPSDFKEHYSMATENK